jgi:hypothetical protein
MPIYTRTWLGRLTVQCPGWYFWYCEQPSTRTPWHAVPAPPGRVAEPLRRRGRVDASTPQALRRSCEERYGWDDECQACGAPARQCGHLVPKEPRRPVTATRAGHKRADGRPVAMRA